jgi:hypothetical protein
MTGSQRLGGWAAGGGAVWPGRRAGKTSVTLEYVHRHLAEVRVGWQFAAEDPAVLEAGFTTLAAQLGAGWPAR